LLHPISSRATINQIFFRGEKNKMLKNLIKNDDTDVDSIVEDLELNWDEDLPLMQLFEKEVEDPNLLFQLERALKHLCILDHRLNMDPSLRHNEDFLKELKSAMNCFLILIIPYGYRGIVIMKCPNGENFHIEIGQERMYILKDFNFYFK
jgi:hypothetical protein